MKNIQSDKVWGQCEGIKNAIINHFKVAFPLPIEIISDIQEYDYLRLFVIKMDFGGGSYATMTVQDRFSDSDAIEPFVYLDSIHIDSGSRGQGIARKFLDCISQLVSNGVFKYMNTKDWSDGFWDYIMTDYSFIREKYSNGFLYG